MNANDVREQILIKLRELHQQLQSSQKNVDLMEELWMHDVTDEEPEISTITSALEFVKENRFYKEKKELKQRIEEFLNLDPQNSNFTERFTP